MPKPAYIKDAKGRRLAYRKTEGKPPCVIFMGGFMSDMEGTKAAFLEQHCTRRGLGYLRFDYSGHGASEGEVKESTIGGWLGDALTVIDRLSKGPLVLIGSSLGGWIAFLAARARAKRVKGLIGLAPALDFTERLLWENLSSAKRRVLVAEGEISVPSGYDESPYVFTRELIEEGRKHLLLKSPLKLPMPVRIIHGLKDRDVPHDLSLEIMKRLDSPDFALELVGGAGHRLSEKNDLARLARTLDEVVALAKA